MAGMDIVPEQLPPDKFYELPIAEAFGTGTTGGYFVVADGGLLGGAMLSAEFEVSGAGHEEAGLIPVVVDEFRYSTGSSVSRFGQELHGVCSFGIAPADGGVPITHMATELRDIAREDPTFVAALVKSPDLPQDILDWHGHYGTLEVTDGSARLTITDDYPYIPDLPKGIA